MTGWVIPWAAWGKLSLLLHRTFLNRDLMFIRSLSSPTTSCCKGLSLWAIFARKNLACSFFTYLLFVFLTLSSVFPSVLQLCGCGLLGVGIWLSVSQGSFATFSPSFPSLSAANMVIAIGAIVMVTGFLGCLGAIKENKCLLLSVS